ncbi:hypothetical protein [Erythrobacter sp. SD-21]|uniref:hypothetical protein n=1 Tax=Erythrobacter sp. SD-21 TaxID=161528 RepID=UPI000153FA89|nr:hypothetical protein [Erythrobacter sp. SD-21]EDL48483.1 hypothetical protein ED21_23243 [Erythrobacter sp. SD-21]
MKHLMLAASALTLMAAPAHAQILGGGGLGGVTGTINSTVDTTLRSSTDRIRSTTRGAARGNASTSGDQNVNRDSGEVSINRSLDAGLDATTSQLLETPNGMVTSDASGSSSASGSGGANAQLIGTDAVRSAAGDTVGRARNGVSTVRNLATPAVGAARERGSGLTGQAGSVAGAARGTASGAGSLDNGMLEVVGSGAADGEGAFAVAPETPVNLPSGEQLGNVRDIVATRRGEIRELVVNTREGPTTTPADNLTGSGSALITGEGSGSASSGDEVSPEPASDEIAE